MGASDASGPPATPQQDAERRKTPSGTPVALEGQFAALEVGAPEDGAQCHSAATPSSSRPGSPRIASSSQGSQSCSSISGGEGSHGAAWPDHDREEPILQHNDERFCLLPVK